MTVRILTGDVRAVLPSLPDGSVHCCVTSPPYWGLRSYLPTEHPGKHLEIGSEPTLQEWVGTMVEVFREVRRVLRPDGTLWLNLGDAYAGGGRGGNVGGSSTLEGSQSSQDACPRSRDQVSSAQRENCPAVVGRRAGGGLKPKDLMGQPWRVAFALQADGWWLRQEIIWDKNNPMPESVRDRCTKSHEHVFLLTKSERYWFDADAIAEPCSESTHARLSQDVQSQLGSARANGGNKANGNMKAVTRGVGWGHGTDAEQRHRGRVKNNASFDAAMAIMPATRNKRSVWRIPTEGFSGAHFATFPTKLVEPCILAGCPEGGTVLDIFGGSGTTGMVADRHHRNAILIDLDERNRPMATDRIIGDAPLFAEVTT